MITIHLALRYTDVVTNYTGWCQISKICEISKDMCYIVKVL